MGECVSALADSGYAGDTCIEAEDKALEGGQAYAYESLRLSWQRMEQYVI